MARAEFGSGSTWIVLPPATRSPRQLRRWQHWLAGAVFMLTLFALATPVYAQENATPQPAIDSPLQPPLPAASPSTTPTASPSETPTSMPTATATETPSPTPTATPTLDLATAALQVSPLRIAPSDQPIGESSGRPWLVLAVAIVLTGAIVMLIAQRRT